MTLSMLGLVRGLQSGASLNAETRLSSPDERACSVSSVSVRATTVKLEIQEGEIWITRDVQVTAPSEWWEFHALRHPGGLDGNESAARRCLFGSPYVREVSSVVTTNGSTTVRISTSEPVGRHSRPDCSYFVNDDLKYRRLELRYRGCESADQAQVSTTTIRLLPGDLVPDVSLLPTTEDASSLEWTWRQPSNPSPDLLIASIPLQFDVYIATYIDTSTWKVGELEIRISNLGFWVPDLILMMVLAFLLVRCRIARRRDAVAIVLVALLLFLGMGVEWWSGRNFDYGRASIAAVGVVALAGATSNRRTRASLVPAGAISLLALAVATLGPQLSGQRLGILGVVFGVAISFVLMGLFEQFWLAVRAVFAVRGSALWGWAAFATQGLLCTVAVYAVTFALGSALSRRNVQEILFWLGTTLTYIVTPVLVVLVAAVAMRALLLRWGGRVIGGAMGGLIGLLWSFVASPGRARLWGGIDLPVGSLLLAAVVGILGGRLKLGARIEHGRLIEVGELDSNGLLARSLFNRGAVGEWSANLKVMLDCALPIALIPMAYVAWNLLQVLPARTTTSTGMAALIAAVLSEGGRWLITAAVFGVLYPFLHGRGGPYKAAGLAAAWFGPAAATELLNRWLGHGTDRVWTFPALQMLLFLVALGVSYDYRTMIAAKGRFAHLQQAYGLERTRSLVVVSAPLMLALLAIAQQVVSGTGFDFVTSLVEGLTKLTPGG